MATVAGAVDAAAAPDAAAAAATTPAAEPAHETTFFNSLVRGVMMYMMVTTVVGMIFPNSSQGGGGMFGMSPGTSVPIRGSGASSTADGADSAVAPAGGGNMYPLWQDGQEFNFNVAISTSPTIHWATLPPPPTTLKDDGVLSVVRWEGMKFRWKTDGGSDIEEKELPIGDMQWCLEQNCTVYAHAVMFTPGCVLQSGMACDVSITTPLTTFMEKKATKLVSLFDDDEEKKEDDAVAVPSDEVVAKSDAVVGDDEPAPWRPYFQDHLTLSPIIDFSALPAAQLPAHAKPFFTIPREASGDLGYLPVIYVNNFWVLYDYLKEQNATTAAEPHTFKLTYSPLSFFKWMIYSGFEQSMSFHESVGTMARKERDETKRIFLETNPWFLALTMVVSWVHLAFEYLAFSNDVKFWKGKKDFKGLSVRTVAVNCYFQLVIFLYLLDGETSYTVSLPAGVGVLIEFWKLAKAIEFVPGTWRIKGFKEQGETGTSDAKAMKYLFYIMVPCLIGYSGYSALYDKHKGWYSFLLRVQVRYIYFTGFIMMTPQLFINYKLKSVAALPWKTFVYKALNTVIDDLFAFIIKMPTMHRIACFRDDLIFLILLYQRYIYPTDRKRANEYGQDGLTDEEREALRAEEEAKAIEDSTEEKSPADAPESKKKR